MSESNLVRPELRIWGKSKGLTSPYPLLAHLVDTAAIAYSLMSGRWDLGQSRPATVLVGKHKSAIEKGKPNERKHETIECRDVGKCLQG